MKKILIYGFCSLLRFVADSVRTPCLMASQSPSPGPESSASNTSNEPRRMSGALIGLILIGALAGVVGVGLWALDQLASQSPTPQETAAPQTPATPTEVPATPEPTPAPAEPAPAPAEPEAAPAEPEAAPAEPEAAPAEPEESETAPEEPEATST